MTDCLEIGVGAGGRSESVARSPGAAIPATRAKGAGGASERLRSDGSKKAKQNSIARPAGACLECGTAFDRPTARNDREFCGASCRRRFNHRREQRGALLYDLFMILRHERGLARVLGVYTVLCALASEFRQEDIAERGGRPSWKPAKAVLERRPSVRARVAKIRAGR